jgi:hypothetical protein
MTHFAMTTQPHPAQRLIDWCLSDAALPFLVGAFEAMVATSFYLVLSGAIG